MTTGTPSLASWTSNSTPSAQAAMANLIAASVFSGANELAPRWAMISGSCLSGCSTQFCFVPLHTERNKNLMLFSFEQKDGFRPGDGLGDRKFVITNDIEILTRRVADLGLFVGPKIIEKLEH